MGLALLPPSHALWQAFHIAWVLSLLVLLPLLKPKIQLSPEARCSPLELYSRAPGLTLWLGSLDGEFPLL